MLEKQPLKRRFRFGLRFKRWINPSFHADRYAACELVVIPQRHLTFRRGREKIQNEFATTAN
jgi:hypothetical protein